MPVSFFRYSGSGGVVGAGPTNYAPQEHSKGYDSTYVDKSLTMYNDGQYPDFRSQVGYGTKPLTAEEIEELSVGKGAGYPHVANHVDKEFFTENTTSDIKATTPSAINGKREHTLNEAMDIIRDEFYIPKSGFSYKERLNELATRYNRFKLPNMDMEIKKGFGHVFFTRPSCHLVANMDEAREYAGQGVVVNSLLPSVQSVGAFNDIYLQNPRLVYEISEAYNGVNTTDFMFLLSNYAKGFSLKDEELLSDTYGKTYTGWKMSYGKTSIESQTANSFSVTYADDRILSIYKLHRMWVDYIHYVYRGRLDPLVNNIANKTLDYCGSVYYILTADDNETILFWTKYYGVYPTSIPSSQYSWSSGSTVDPGSLTIEYNYSWKQDFSPTAIQEFNMNARLDNLKSGLIRYVPTYDSTLCHAGPTIVGTPYIDAIGKKDVNKYPHKFKDETLPEALPFTDDLVYKLRFAPASEMPNT